MTTKKDNNNYSNSKDIKKKSIKKEINIIKYDSWKLIKL